MATESLPQTAHQWVLRARPQAGVNVNEHFELKKDVPLFSGPTDGKILVKLSHFSVDPAQMTWINKNAAKGRLYVPPIAIGDPVTCGAIGEVLESWNPDFPKGCLVFGYFAWADYLLADPAYIAKTMTPVQIVPPGTEPSDFLTLGLTAVTAYLSLIDIGKISAKDSTIVISGAAGGLGSIACQIAKSVYGIKKVVGIAGTKEKCDFLKESLNVDVTLNYRDADFEQQFIDATPDYIDLYLDNVAGSVLNLACKRIKNGGRIIACGGISYYEATTVPPAINMDGYMELIYQNASVLGVIVTNHIDSFPRIIGDLIGWVTTGKIKLIKDIKEVPLEMLPEGLPMMLQGKNTGKLILQLKA